MKLKRPHMMDPIEKSGKSNCPKYVLSKGGGPIFTDGRSVWVVRREHRTDSCWKKARLKLHTNREKCDG